MSTIENTELAHLVSVCRSAARMGRPGPLSHGEALAAALVLNRPDWLAERNYTIVEALQRIGETWVGLLGEAARVLKEDACAAAVVKEGLARAAVRPQLPEEKDEPVELDYHSELKTYSQAPGYRDVGLVFQLTEWGNSKHTFRAHIHVRPQDGEDIVRQILEVHRWAWNRGEPLDRQPGERRPRWIGGATPSTSGFTPPPPA